MPTLKKLNVLALTLLITGAIDSIRNLPATALFGTSLVFFFVLSAIFFLLPTALISAELAANTDEGGIYHWARLAFGEKIGFLAIWLQWVSNIVWFPTILSFIAGTAAYLINPGLALNKFYLVSVVLATFWTLTILNFKGIRLSAKFTSFCAFIGLVVPMFSIIALLIAWLLLGKPLQLHLTTTNMFPNWHQSDNWVALTAIMMGFAGMELATVHVKDVENPQKTFPRALTISTFIIFATTVLGSLAIAFVLPYNQIHLVNGTIETFAYFLSAYHLKWIIPILTVMIILGSLGGVISWIISPIKGLSQSANHGFLPKILEKQNEYGVPQNLLITQAILVSVVCLGFLLFPSVNASYWLLSDLSTQLYMLMYLLMFICALRLRKKITYAKDTFVVPGKRAGHRLICLLGLLGTCITLAVGFIPPGNMNIGSKIYYEMLFCLGLGAMILPIVFFYWYQRRSSPALIPVVETEIS